ncbi:ATP-binding protein [Streptomyces sp. NPDC048612]|uniref:ATP-binding protein n=1 Tax=Streptomyces sp. NPDC048612 TaxID=3365579 RepID=UPI003716D2D2
MSQARTLLTRSRLLTLTGAGGIGKTRLALRIARDVRRSFPDGAWVVDLGPVEDEALVAQTVLAALGLDHTSALPVMTVLVDHLADKQLLLVLDNCEHLLNASAVLVRTLLAAAPGLKVLVTSRQSLGIDAEALLTVPPLSTPNPDRPPPPKAMLRCSCSWSGPRPSSANSHSVRTIAGPSPASATVWTVSRSRSSWRQPGCGCCVLSSSSPFWATVWIC